MPQGFPDALMKTLAQVAALVIHDGSAFTPDPGHSETSWKSRPGTSHPGRQRTTAPSG